MNGNGTALTVKQDDSVMYSLIVNGDVSKLSPDQQAEYYTRMCDSLGLNPLTKPFDYITLSGKRVLYAKKDATEQLRKINGVSVSNMDSKTINDVIIVQVQVSDKSGRTDIATGAVNIKGLQGDALANAIMKAETKAKRRATLSICGLGILDETELETIPEVKQLPAAKVPEAAPVKQKGDYKQASAAIGAAKTIAEIEKYSKMLSTRTWTDDEAELLDNLIEDKRTEIGGK